MHIQSRLVCFCSSPPIANPFSYKTAHINITKIFNNVLDTYHLWKIEVLYILLNTVVNPIMVTNSTDYYRQNRRAQKVVYKCPHCKYCTHNCRITLTNHINSKHKTEESRPFQCTECNRGFAQKAHLIRHLETEHDITGGIEHSKTTTLLYIIMDGPEQPRSTKTKARCDYYKNHHLCQQELFCLFPIWRQGSNSFPRFLKTSN